MKKITMSHKQYARQLEWTKAKAKYKLLKKFQQLIDQEMKAISSSPPNKSLSKKERKQRAKDAIEQAQEIAMANEGK
jgi:hypothetical protein